MTSTLDPASYAAGLRDAAAMLDVDRQTIRLHAWEMTAAEMRTVPAWRRRSKSPERQLRAQGMQDVPRQAKV